MAGAASLLCAYPPPLREVSLINAGSPRTSPSPSPSPSCRTLTMTVVLLVLVKTCMSGTHTPGYIVDAHTCICTAVNANGKENSSCSVSDESDISPFRKGTNYYPESPRSLRIAVENVSAERTQIVASWEPPGGASNYALEGFLVEFGIVNDITRQLLHLADVGPYINPSSVTPENWVIRCDAKNTIFDNTVLAMTKSLPKAETGGWKQTYDLIHVGPHAKMFNDNPFYWEPAYIKADLNQARRTIRVNFPFKKEFADRLVKFVFQIYKDGYTASKSYHNQYEQESVPLSEQQSNVEMEMVLSEDYLKARCIEIQILKICADSYGGEAGYGYCRKVPHGPFGIPEALEVIEGNCTQPPAASTPASTPTSTSQPATNTTDMYIYVTPGGITPRRVLGRPTPPPGEGADMLAIVLPVIVAVFIICLLLTAVVCRSRRTKTLPPPGHVDHSCLHPCLANDNDSLYGDHVTPIDPIPLESPKVFLYYSATLEKHKQVIRRWAQFLQTHFSCNVVLDQWTNEVNQCPMQWYLQKLDEADKVIFIHSEETLLKYDVWLHPDHTRPKPIIDHSALGDTFTMIMGQVYDDVMNEMNSERAKRYIMARFPYSPETCMKYIRQSKFPHYVIPRDLKPFAYDLHNINEYEFQKINTLSLPNGQNYTQTESGRKLRDAIGEACIYVKENPNWLNQHIELAQERPLSAGVKIGPTGEDDKVSEIAAIFEETPITLSPPNSQVDIPAEVRSSEAIFSGPPDDDDRDSETSFSGSAHSLPALAPSWHDVIGECVVDSEHPEPHGLQTVGVDPVYDSGLGASIEAYPSLLLRNGFITPEMLSRHLDFDIANTAGGDLTSGSVASSSRGLWGAVVDEEGGGIGQLSLHPPESISTDGSSLLGVLNDDEDDDEEFGMPPSPHLLYEPAPLTLTSQLPPAQQQQQQSPLTYQPGAMMPISNGTLRVPDVFVQVPDSGRSSV